MSTITPVKAYVFHTDIGVVKQTVAEITNFDIEDVVRSGASSEASKMMFGLMAKNRDINSPDASRTIKTAYSENE